jgi:hypothetical protein
MFSLDCSDDPVMRSLRFLAVAVLAVLMIAFIFQPVAVAAGSLDQQQTSILSGLQLYSSPPAPSTQFLGQTFTAGLTGPLTEVDLAVACIQGETAGYSCTSNGPVTVEIHPGDPTGAPTLASASLSSSAIPTITASPPSEFVAFVFSSPPDVVAGSVYAIVITASNAPYDNYTVGYCFPLVPGSDCYVAGTARYYDGSWHETDPSGQDLAFKTYVTPPQISLSPTCGPPGTKVVVTGSGFTRHADSFCEIHSSPAGLVGTTRGTDFDCNILADGSVSGPDGPAFFVVAAGASGSYWVTVYYAPAGETPQESAPIGFSTQCSGTMSGPVGGFVESVNKLTIAAPYLALLGLATVIAVVAVAPWKKPDN